MIKQNSCFCESCNRVINKSKAERLTIFLYGIINTVKCPYCTTDLYIFEHTYYKPIVKKQKYKNILNDIKDIIINNKYNNHAININ
jgi:hypothetical protein